MVMSYITYLRVTANAVSSRAAFADIQLITKPVCEES
jgi:hypothetical protein